MLLAVLELYKMETTVFSMDELAQIFPNIKYGNLKRRVSYWVKSGKLIRVRRGLFAKANFNKMELAGKIYRPSYVSLETVLAKDGVVFQKYETIQMASYLSREVTVLGNNYRYFRLKDEVLLNRAGVEKIGGVWMASRERAFLDTLYLRKNYHFDNLGPLDRKKVREMAKIYKSKALLRRVEDYV